MDKRDELSERIAGNIRQLRDARGLTQQQMAKLWRLGEGDVVVFRGDQRHSYGNPGRVTAVGYSVVILAPVS